MSSRSKTVANSYDGKIAGLYDLEDTLGRGHFAVVKLARHVFTGEKVAVKVIDKTKLDEVSRAHLFQEVRCMKLVQHPNVVRLYEVIDTQTKLYLILELGDGGDLYDYIMKHDKGLDEESARKYFRQIVHAISYCHRLHVVHRDLKPENVVFFEKLGMVKLTDFGFSNRFCPGQKLETSCGSLAYSAPEILLGDSYDAPAVDVWSLGVILYMLVCGRAPFQEANDSETLTMIMDCKYTIPAHVTEECKLLIRRMLIRDPEKRSTLEEITNDEWLRSGGNIQPADYLPLVSKDQLSEDDHEHILQKMANGNIATKDDIIEALEKNRYNHISATYFLLAERKLRAHRQEQARLLSTAYRSDLSALAISPRNPTVSSSYAPVVTPGSSATAGLLSPIATAAKAAFPVSPPGLSDPFESPHRFRMASKGHSQVHSGSLLAPMSTHGHGNVRKAAGMSVPPFQQRGTSPVRGFLGFPAPLRGNMTVLMRDSKKKKKEEDGEEVKVTVPEEHDRTVEMQVRKELGKNLENDASKKKAPALSLGVLNRLRQLPSPNRRLHSVQSSPQLTLNEIFEETESSDGEAAGLVGHVPPAPVATRSLVLPLPILGASVATIPSTGVLSPGMLRKYEHQRRRYAKARTTSCSSSDASDEDSEHRKRKAEKLESLAGRSGGPWGKRGGEDDDDANPGAPASKGTTTHEVGGSGGGSGGASAPAAQGGGANSQGGAGTRQGSMENGSGGGNKRERTEPPAQVEHVVLEVEVADATGDSNQAVSSSPSHSSESLAGSCTLTNGGFSADEDAQGSFASPPSTPPSVISLRQSKTLHNISKYSGGSNSGHCASPSLTSIHTHQQRDSKGKTKGDTAAPGARGLFGVRGLLHNLRRGYTGKHSPGEATTNGKGYGHTHQRPLSEPGGSGSCGGPSKNRGPSLYRLLDKRDLSRSPKSSAVAIAASSNPSSTGSSASSSPSAAAKRFDINQNGIRTGRGAVAGSQANGGGRRGRAGALPLPPAPIAVLSSPATNGHNFAVGVGIGVVGGESSHSSKCCSLC